MLSHRPAPETRLRQPRPHRGDIHRAARKETRSCQISGLEEIEKQSPDGLMIPSAMNGTRGQSSLFSLDANHCATSGYNCNKSANFGLGCRRRVFRRSSPAAGRDEILQNRRSMVKTTLGRNAELVENLLDGPGPRTFYAHRPNFSSGFWNYFPAIGLPHCYFWYTYESNPSFSSRRMHGHV